MTNYSRKRPLGGWLIVPIVIGVGFLSVSLGRLYALESQAGIITPTMECPWSEAIRKALGDTPKDRSPISNSTWNEAIHNALEISLPTKRQGFLPGNNLGIRVSYLSPSASRQFSKSSSIELYGIFDLKPGAGDEWTQSRGRFCLEGFIDFLPMQTKSYAPFPNLNTPEWLSDLTSISLGGSILYKYQERDFGVYLGGGMAYYHNEFKLPSQSLDYAWNYFKDYYGEPLVYLEYQEEVENTIGLHLRAGAEIQLSGNVFLSLAIKQTFVTAGVTRQADARTRQDELNYWYRNKTKGEIDLSTFALGVGLSLWF